jgi:DNA-binding helix-hairpin-helix protein with protein kinase domain
VPSGPSASWPGRPIARGRDAEVYAIGDGRVLRRYRSPGPTEREMRVMAHARAHGYPVPQVHLRRLLRGG